MLRLTVGLVFLVVPMLELLLLIKIGQGIGALPTVALVIGTALTGAYIISRQSLAVVSRALEALSQGRTPMEPVLDGLFLMVAGALLLTPGLITDALALVLLVPPLRRLIARPAMRWNFWPVTGSPGPGDPAVVARCPLLNVLASRNGRAGATR